MQLVRVLYPIAIIRILCFFPHRSCYLLEKSTSSTTSSWITFSPSPLNQANYEKVEKLKNLKLKMVKYRAKEVKIPFHIQVQEDFWNTYVFFYDINNYITYMQKIYKIILPIQFIIEKSCYKNMQHIFHIYNIYLGEKIWIYVFKLYTIIYKSWIKKNWHKCWRLSSVSK